MIVGVPREIKADEYRVALLPVGAEELTAAGHTVLIEAGAGQGSGIADAQYLAAGATLVEGPGAIWSRADLVVKVKEPQEEEWLRQALQEHVYHTRSPRAERLLGRRGSLPLLRVEPVHFQGSVEATWKPVLAQFEQRQQILPAPPTAAISRTALPA